MDFNQLVMNEVDAKYKDMAKGKTNKPFAQNPRISSNGVYEKKRDDYKRRLSQEQSEINKAINQINNTRNARLKFEEQKRKEKARKRQKYGAVAKKVFFLAIIIGILTSLFGFVIWPKMIYPNMDAKSLYTPEIVQAYCGSYSSGVKGSAVVTITSCDKNGKIDGTFEFVVDDEYGKYEITGQITEKKNNGNLTLTITPLEWILKPNDFKPLAKMKVEISDNYQSFTCSQYDMNWTVGENDEYSIKNAEDLQKLVGAEATFQLKNDIDLSGINWTPIEGFTGTLMGNGYTIRNLSIISSDSNVGLFSTLNGIVMNLNIDNVNIEVSGRNENIGVLCGKLESGMISNVSTSGNVYASQSNNVGGISGSVILKNDSDIQLNGLHSNSIVTGDTYVGGILGYFFHDSAWYKTNNLYDFINNGTVDGIGDYVAGIIGYIDTDLGYLYITEFENTGAISGRNYVGGIIGYGKTRLSNSHIRDSKNSARIEAEALCGCIAGQLDIIAIDNCSNAGSSLSATKYISDDGENFAYVGGYVGKGFVASNCTNNVEIAYTAGGKYVGGIMGAASFELDSDIVCENLVNNKSITGADYVGGIIGYFYHECSWYDVNQFTNIINNGNINGLSNVGGILGYIDTDLGYLYITDPQNTANVAGEEYIGEIIGFGKTRLPESNISGAITTGGDVCGYAENIVVK